MNPDSVFFRQLPYKIEFPLIPVPEHKVLTVLYQIIQVILSGKLINLSVQSVHRDLNTTYRGFEASEIGYTKGNMYSKIVVEIKLRSEERRVGKECKNRWRG